MAKQNQKPAIAPGINRPQKAGIPASKDKRTFSQVQKCLFFLIAISFLAYGNTLSNGYVLDDASVMEQNIFVAKGISAIPVILSSPYHQGFYRAPNNDTTAVNDLYRPLSLVVFAAERQFFSNAPAPAHFINILIFAACVVLLFIFLHLLLQRKQTGVAFIASLLFAIHPIHTEVTANVKSLDELLCFLFSFSALIIFIKYVSSGKRHLLVAGALCYFLSLLAKETSICFLGIFPLVFFFYFNENKRRSMYLSLASAGVAVVYLAIRFSVLRAYNADSPDIIYFTDNPLVGAPSLAAKAATIIFIMGYYIRLLIIPYPLSCNYAYKAIPFMDFGSPWVWLSLIVYLGLVFAGIRRLFLNKKDPYAFGTLFFLATITLFSNIFFLIGASMADRFLFFPSAGFCLIVALLLWKWLGNENYHGGRFLLPAKIWLALAPPALVFTLITVSRNADWKDNLTLFKTDLAHFPQNAWLYHAVGAELASSVLAQEQDSTEKKRIIHESIFNLQKSASIYSGDYKVHNELGNLYVKINKFDSAEWEMKQAIALAPTIPVPLSDLGAIYFYQQKYRLAIEFCDKARVINPQNKNILNNLAICYLQAKVYDSAALFSKKSLEIDPDNTFASQIFAAATRNMNATDTLKK